MSLNFLIVKLNNSATELSFIKQHFCRHIKGITKQNEKYFNT